MYLTDLVTLPRFIFGRGVYARFPALCAPLGSRFAVIGGETAMQKGLPSLRAAIQNGGPVLLDALPFGGACTQQAMDRLDNMSQSLGELIDQEETLLRNVMESDKKRK